jgi:hypothetical protein
MTHETTPNTGYATALVTKAPDWHGLVAWDIWLNNLSTGLFLVAAVSELTAPAIFTPMARVAYPVALILVMADLVLLVLDLGDPLRFHHMLRVFKPSSPMSLGVWCLSGYAFLLTLLAVLPGAADGSDWARRTLVLFTVLPALCSLVYKGVLFSTSSQPVWKDARWLGAYLTSAALVLGGAEMLALAVLTGPERATSILHLVLGLLLVLNVVPLALLVANVRAGLVGSSHRRHLTRVAVFALAAGMLLPLCLLFVAESTLATLAAVLFILLGSLIIRFVIVELPRSKENA